jgi:hypothetical protein
MLASLSAPAALHPLAVPIVFRDDRWYAVTIGKEVGIFCGWYVAGSKSQIYYIVNMGFSGITLLRTFLECRVHTTRTPLTKPLLKLYMTSHLLQGTCLLSCNVV